MKKTKSKNPLSVFIFLTWSGINSEIYIGFWGCLGKYKPKRFLHATRCRLNLSSGENRAGWALCVIFPSGVSFCNFNIKASSTLVYRIHYKLNRKYRRWINRVAMHIAKRWLFFGCPTSHLSLSYTLFLDTNPSIISITIHYNLRTFNVYTRFPASSK